MGHGAFWIIGGDDAGLYFRHGDHLGSTSVLSNGAGLKVAGSGVLYAPFGEIRQGEQSALTDFGYTGQRLDGSTGGLMYYGARYYLPGLCVEHRVGKRRLWDKVLIRAKDGFFVNTMKPETRQEDLCGGIQEQDITGRNPIGGCLVLISYGTSINAILHYIL